MNHIFRIVIISLAICSALVGRAQTWTKVANTPDIGAFNPTLLTDGSVLIQNADRSDWWRLTPDVNGNYASGTWTQLASTPGYGPLYYASAVMADGRVFTMGGEYNLGNNAIWSNLGYIYDPVLNVWTFVSAPSGWSNIGDMGSVVLPNGKILVCNPYSSQSALFDPATNTFTVPYGTGKFDGNDEEGLTLLPNGTVLVVDATPNHSEIFNPATQTWTSAGTTPANLVGQGLEIGPQVLRPDGTVICFGGGGHNCIYNTVTGQWSLAPDFPSVNGTLLDCADAPACLLPNGNVLVMASPGLFLDGCQFFEWDGTSLNATVNTPNGPFEPSYVGNMLMLPSGQVLLTDQTSSVMLYTPTGTPNPSWAPTITNVASTLLPGKSYVITGTQFNGLSGCSAYGDDQQNATNYPLIRITNTATGHITYCREFNPSTMGICTGTKAVSTNFTVPSGIETGPSTLQVVTNGIASQTVSVNIPPPLQLTIAPNSVGGGASAIGTVTLNTPAPSKGTIVNLSSNSAAALVPGSVTVAAGATTANFTISTTTVASAVTATLSAVTGANSTSAALTINPVSIQFLTFSPPAVIGGATSTGTVTLNGPSSAGDVTVSLSSNTASAVVPATVTILQGATSATFTATTNPVSKDVSAVVTATQGNTTITGSLTVQTPLLSSVGASPNSLIGGNVSVGTITLARPAPQGGSIVSLSATTGASVPATVTVSQGSTSATFNISTAGQSSVVTSTITATLAGTSRTATVTIAPASLTKVSADPNPVVGGNPCKGTVTLNGFAPPGGLTVSLTSSSASVTVPSSVTVSAGASSATFSVGTQPVSAAGSATITATAGSVTQTTTLAVQSASLSRVALTPTSIVGSSKSIVTGTVTFTGPSVSAGETVKLTSSNPSIATVPASVKVAGGATSAAFAVGHKLVSATQNVTITATYGTVQQTATLTVNPFQVVSVQFSPTSIAGGTKSTGTVQLNAPVGTSPVSVKLASSTKVVTVPSAVSVAAGQLAATFTTTSTVVTAKTTATVTGTYGASSQQGTLSVEPAGLFSISVTPATVKGSATTVVTGTVTLSGPAPKGGLVVSLSSSNSPAASVPGSVTIAAGRTSATFRVAHSKVSQQTSATLTGTLSGVSKTTTLTVTP